MAEMCWLLKKTHMKCVIKAQKQSSYFVNIIIVTQLSLVWHKTTLVEYPVKINFTLQA